MRKVYSAYWGTENTKSTPFTPISLVRTGACVFGCAQTTEVCSLTCGPTWVHFLQPSPTRGWTDKSAWSGSVCGQYYSVRWRRALRPFGSTTTLDLLATAAERDRPVACWCTKLVANVTDDRRRPFVKIVLPHRSPARPISHRAR